MSHWFCVLTDDGYVTFRGDNPSVIGPFPTHDDAFDAAVVAEKNLPSYLEYEVVEGASTVRNDHMEVAQKQGATERVIDDV